MATRIPTFLLLRLLTSLSLPKAALIWEDQQVTAVGVVLEKGRRGTSPLDVTAHSMPVFTALTRAQKSTPVLLPALRLSCR